MKKFYTIAAVLLALSLTACGTPTKNILAALAEAEAGSFRVAQDYVELPDCAVAGSGPVCSDTDTVLNIETGKDAAHAALVEARDALDNPLSSGSVVDKAVLAATKALSFLRQITPKLGVQ